MLANRKAYLGNTTKLDDTSPCMMWRWEVISYDMFPQNDTLMKRVKKRKTHRGKMRIWYNAIHRTTKAIHKFLKSEDMVLWQKVKEEEEKLLKIEEEKEKAAQRLQEKELERIEKEKLLEERQRIKEAKQKERELEKEQARKLKEEEREKAKKLKEEEKEIARKLKEEETMKEFKQKEEKILKNKKRLLSFFHKPAKSPITSKSSSIQSKSIKTCDSSDFDSAAFRSKMNSCTYTQQQPLFSTLSSKARKSRRRNTKSVEVTIESTCAVSPSQMQPCIELKIISVPNKYKYLKFFEDCRPPYCGTWCKTSKLITGKHPFQKDTSFLDYDYDSEAEWEEEEPGEDLEEDEVDDDVDDMEKLAADEGVDINDTRTYNFEDGWIMEDDDVSYSEDEEKTILRRDNKTKKDFTSTSLLIVPPITGGFPPFVGNNTLTVEGNGNAIQEAKHIFQDLTCELLLREGETEPSLISLDPFPPPIENVMKDISKSDDPKPVLTDQDQLRVFARFVHNNELNSRDKLQEELIVKFQECGLQVPIRATLYRTLIANAEKRKVSTGSGVVIFWEVKKELLLELGLTDLMVSKVYLDQLYLLKLL